MTIQERLNILQPYVTGLRYVKGTPILDAKLKDKWTVPKSEIIKYAPIDEKDPLTLVFFSEDSRVGFDELLDFVEVIIKTNIERQRKTEFLKAKKVELLKLVEDTVEDLKKKLRVSPLSQLQDIKYSIIEGKPNVIEFTEEDDEIFDEEPVIQVKAESKMGIDAEAELTKRLNEEMAITIPPHINPEEVYVEPARDDDNFDPDEKEIPTPHQVKKGEPKQTKVRNIELPPRNQQPKQRSGSCNCGPEEFCDLCMDDKL